MDTEGSDSVNSTQQHSHCKGRHRFTSCYSNTPQDPRTRGLPLRRTRNQSSNQGVIRTSKHSILHLKILQSSQCLPVKTGKSKRTLREQSVLRKENPSDSQDRGWITGRDHWTPCSPCCTIITMRQWWFLVSCVCTTFERKAGSHTGYGCLKAMT